MTPQTPPQCATSSGAISASLTTLPSSPASSAGMIIDPHGCPPQGPDASGWGLGRTPVTIGDPEPPELLEPFMSTSPWSPASVGAAGTLPLELEEHATAPSSALAPAVAAIRRSSRGGVGADFR